jgi:transcriptional regulator with XRE-family HTH domain
MPKDKHQPEEPYIPSSFEAHHLAEAMRKMLGSMVGHVENLGVDVEGMAAMVPLASGMQAERKRRGASYKEVAEELKVRQRDIKAIEAGSPDEVDGKVLVAYADWLGMGDSLRQWIANHPKYAAKLGLAKLDTPGESTPGNVIPFQADMPPGKGAAKPSEPGEVLPMTAGTAETKTSFGGMDLIKKFVSGDAEMMASLEAEFSKFDVSDTEMFESEEPDIDELTANPALPATYEFEISLLDIKPRIWRRFRVSNELTFQQFHEVVQTVMGWTDSHLHAFDVFGATIEGEASLDVARDEEVVHDARNYQLCDFDLEEKDEIGYEYDFGDGWEHAIVLKKILPADPTAVPVCLKGKRACPLEDSHGPFGYQEMLKALADENHPSHEEWMEWTDGRPVDSETFDLEEVNEALAELPSHWKARRKERSGDK